MYFYSFNCTDESERFDSKLYFNYSCKLSENGIIHNNCPQRANLHELDAFSESITTCVTTKMKDVITCVEGIEVFFPLFLVLNQPGECEAIPDKTLLIQVKQTHVQRHSFLITRRIIF